MFKIDQYAYANKLRQMHPGEKFAFALLTMTICLAAPVPLVHLVVIMLMAGMVVLRAGIPARFYCKLLALPLSFLLLSVLAVCVSVTSHPGVPVYGPVIHGYAVGVTLAGLYQAGLILGKSLAAVSCLYFLSLTTPVVEIISLLRRLRLPSLFLELMGLIYRYIFVVMETADRMYISQSSRQGYASLKTAYHSLGQLVSNLFIKSYYRSSALYTALSSRGYTGDLPVLDNSFRLSGRNIIFIFLVELFLAGLAWHYWRWPF
ncbi:cobalt ECF transporter T component CbiQ [Desulfofundulus thermobenzoicus]|uniref:Cobalt ECF transporter T component CbiQ n=1 Tax=Desulfofundulus thermobenzoicus TaxID=29376 RepID=A0A6N7IRC2_9FIRM|nr:cobalt ECF transporter T component CbiQ [Desulfofundulus thermobenzoicus]HHW45137.1 cobalt ECF transporter T component CbiQ [Desulfotomaculum sp.]